MKVANQIFGDLIHIFRLKFPDANYDYRIYFLPSLLWFAGRAGILDDGSVAVAFGVDAIARNNENVAVLFAHEMFHALHYRTLGVGQKRSLELENLRDLLWLEGLASYVSAVVTDHVLDSSIFGKLGGMCETSRTKLKNLFRAELARSETSSDESILDTWYGSGNKARGIPPMAGYCLGFWTVQKLAQSVRLSDLVTNKPLA